MSEKNNKKVRKEMRKIAKTTTANQFNDYMRKAYREVKMYRVIVVVYTIILIILGVIVCQSIKIF